MTYEKLEATLQYGEETFKVRGSFTVNPGFSTMTPWACARSKAAPNLNQGDSVRIRGIHVDTKHTRAPDFLTESELLGKMEQYGIGTDASMPIHINNICERNYVKVEHGRRLVPT